MRWLIVSLLLIAPAYADEPEPEMVTIPKTTLINLIQNYQQQKEVNNTLMHQHEKVQKMIETWQNSTNCT